MGDGGLPKEDPDKAFPEASSPRCSIHPEREEARPAWRKREEQGRVADRRAISWQRRWRDSPTASVAPMPQTSAAATSRAQPAASAPPAGTRGASGISGFVYPGCNKAFKESTGLRRHYGCCQLHQVYLCPAEDCEYYASRLGLLNEHFRATHTPTLPHCQRWDEMVERGAGPCLSANQGLLRRKSL